jgi:RecB family endonuclease NucS
MRSGKEWEVEEYLFQHPQIIGAGVRWLARQIGVPGGNRGDYARVSSKFD